MGNRTLTNQAWRVGGYLLFTLGGWREVVVGVSIFMILSLSIAKIIIEICLTPCPEVAKACQIVFVVGAARFRTKT